MRRHDPLNSVIVIGQLGFLWTADKLYIRILAYDQTNRRPNTNKKNNIVKYHEQRRLQAATNRLP